MEDCDSCSSLHFVAIFLSLLLCLLPQAEGYEDGATVLYKRFTLTEFLKASNPVDFLAKANEVCVFPRGGRRTPSVARCHYSNGGRHWTIG